MTEIFKMFSITAADYENIMQSVNKSHAHDFEELIVGRQGRLEHFIDIKSRIMDAPFISFITQGKIHRVRPIPKDGQCDIWVLRFKSDLLLKLLLALYASFHDKAKIWMQGSIELFGVSGHLASKYAVTIKKGIFLPGTYRSSIVGYSGRL